MAFQIEHWYLWYMYLIQVHCYSSQDADQLKFANIQLLKFWLSFWTVDWELESLSYLMGPWYFDLLTALKWMGCEAVESLNCKNTNIQFLGVFLNKVHKHNVSDIFSKINFLSSPQYEEFSHDFWNRLNFYIIVILPYFVYQPG